MRWYRRRRMRSDELITASEIACFAYCAEQWRLHYGLGQAPENRAALDAGTRHHASKALAERLASVAILLGRCLAVLGALTVFLVWLLSR